MLQFKWVNRTWLEKNEWEYRSTSKCDHSGFKKIHLELGQIARMLAQTCKLRFGLNLESYKFGTILSNLAKP